MTDPVVSIVVPVFNEEESLSILHGEIREALKNEKYYYEIIFIDDASNDDSALIIKKLVQEDSCVRGLKMRCNTRKSGAFEAGFAVAKGNFIVTMDADLQDDPEDIPKLLGALENAEVAIGWRKGRRDGLGKNLPSFFVNKLANLLLMKRFHDMNCGFKAYRRSVIDRIPLHGSLYRFIPHLLQMEGFNVVEVKVNNRRRRYGKSKFSIEHRLRGVFDLCTVFFLTRYGNRPLHFFGMLGGTVFAIGFANFLYLLVFWFQGQGIGTRPLLPFSLIAMVIGIQIGMVGFIGELLLYHTRLRKDGVANNYEELN